MDKDVYGVNRRIKFCITSESVWKKTSKQGVNERGKFNFHCAEVSVLLSSFFALVPST